MEANKTTIHLYDDKSTNDRCRLLVEAIMNNAKWDGYPVFYVEDEWLNLLFPEEYKAVCAKLRKEYIENED